MPSLIPNFEYDVFISYRQNDNRSGWVKRFVNALEMELAVTLKDPVSIYFDVDPHAGLRETDDVNKSIEKKLKCVIFIPIISQTYCDPKSFAWEMEFCAFNREASHDQFGRDVKLLNGNVASRILPIKIHDLDLADTLLLESELGTKLRAVEFIFSSPGVNRPLTATDKRDNNTSNTVYRDQVNKVANAVKEIITSLRHPDAHQTSPGIVKPAKAQIRFNKRNVVMVSFLIPLFFAGYFLYSKLSASTAASDALNKSIAVLSFIDMSPSHDQEYLGDGIAEEILNALTKIKGLKVIGRTSSFSFKGKDIDLKAIGEALGAKTILEGSVRKSGHKIRITAQLINANDEIHIWSEQYDSELEDIFTVQEDIAEKIVQKLKGTFFTNGEGRAKAPTNNIAAYEMILRARYFRAKGLEGQKTSIEYYQNALELDTAFAQAYAELSQVYWNSGYLGVSNQKESFAKAEEAAAKSIQLDKNCYDGYNALSFLNLTKDWDWKSSLESYEKAVASGLPVPDRWHAYYQCWLYGINDDVINDAKLLVEKDPLSVEALVHLSRIYFYAKQYENVVANAKRTLELSPNQSSIQRQLGEAYLFSSRPALALPYFQNLMKIDPRYVPQDLIAAYVKLGDKSTALAKFNELKDSMGTQKKAICYMWLGEMDKAFAALDQAYLEKDAGMIGIKIDPHFDAVRSDPRFMAMLKKMNFP